MYNTFVNLFMCVGMNKYSSNRVNITDCSNDNLLCGTDFAINSISLCDYRKGEFQGEDIQREFKKLTIGEDEELPQMNEHWEIPQLT